MAPGAVTRRRTTSIEDQGRGMRLAGARVPVFSDKG